MCLASLALALAGAEASCRRAADASEVALRADDLWGLRALPTFEIVLAPGAREALAAAPREWVHAELRYAGARWRDVGVRLKGHRTMRRLDGKPSFKVRLDRFVKGQSFLGLRELTLNGMVEDPTLVREALGYRLFREVGVPAPETAYAQVVVDGEPYGLYLLVESVDRAFLRRRFGERGGTVFEGSYGCDLYPDDVDGFEVDVGDERADRADLADLARTAAGPVAGLVGGPRAAFDDSALAYLATSAVLGDFDGYRHAHNYHLHRRTDTGRWVFIPWGIDRVFEKRLDAYDSNGLVARRCFADHDCRLAYLRELRRVLDALDRLHLDQGVTVLSGFIARAAAADHHRDLAPDAMAAARARLRSFLAGRARDLADQLACVDGDREVDRDGDGYGCMDCDDHDARVHPGAAEVFDGRDDDCSGLADDIPSLPCPAVVIDGDRFELCDLPMSWQEAAAFCAAKSGALARIDSGEQSRAIDREARRIDAHASWWIGLGDRQQEGAFRWSDGAPLESGPAEWATGQPDNGSCNQDCVALRRDGGGAWSDTHCAERNPFVCRVPAADGGG